MGTSYKVLRVTMKKAYYWTSDPRSLSDLSFNAWQCFDLTVMTILINSMKPNIATIIMFQSIAKTV